MDGCSYTKYDVVCSIWFCLQQYIIKEWDNLLAKMIKGTLSDAEAWKSFQKDFGCENVLFSRVSDNLFVPYTAYGIV
jgi:hypothetical protein